MVKAKKFITSDGRRKFSIVNIEEGTVTIQFEDDNSIYKVNEYEFMFGINNPNSTVPISFEDPKESVLGRYFMTNSGIAVKLTSVPSFKDVNYQFQDNDMYCGVTTMQNIRNGQIKNPYDRNSWGGYIGEGPYNIQGNEYEKKYSLYNRWNLMGVRATGMRSKYDCFYDGQLYENCAICDKWLCFNEFADWFVKHIEKLNPSYIYQVDKDLLYPMYRNQTNGLKLYSPTTCVLLPNDLNLLLANYNKCANSKEKMRLQLIEMSEFYHNTNGITDKSYRAIESLTTGRTLPYIDFRHNDYLENIHNKNIDGLI